MAEREPRELQSRDATKRAPINFTPAATLPDPLPQAGCKFRWIMTHLMGKEQATNVSVRAREGWVPVKLKDHPELALGGDPEGNVEVGGLMLCKAPIEFVEARNAYYAKQAQAQVDSVDNHFMRQNDARMPLFSERKSQTTFGTGKK